MRPDAHVMGMQAAREKGHYTQHRKHSTADEQLFEERAEGGAHVVGVQNPPGTGKCQCGHSRELSRGVARKWGTAGVEDSSGQPFADVKGSFSEGYWGSPRACTLPDGHAPWAPTFEIWFTGHPATRVSRISFQKGRAGHLGQHPVLGTGL